MSIIEDLLNSCIYLAKLEFTLFDTYTFSFWSVFVWICMALILASVLSYFFGGDN